MQFFYSLVISFIMIFLAELGDKTQLLVLSFSSTLKTKTILIGIAIGTFFSHGLAILFGSNLGLLENSFFNTFIKSSCYLSFILIGLISLLPKKETLSFNEYSNKKSILDKIYNLKINPFLIIALTIMIGEIGDKTFLSSIGFGIEYPNYKIALIIGSILGMMCSNFLAIIFGKMLNKYISQDIIKKFSSILFIIFGLLRIFTLKKSINQTLFLEI